MGAPCPAGVPAPPRRQRLEPPACACVSLASSLKPQLRWGMPDDLCVPSLISGFEDFHFTAPRRISVGVPLSSLFNLLTPASRHTCCLVPLVVNAQLWSRSSPVLTQERHLLACLPHSPARQAVAELGFSGKGLLRGPPSLSLAAGTPL